LAKHGIKREEIWITTKIAMWNMAYDNAKESMNNSLNLL
jgi:diketogulonate reductase-like aldo/keto reductase